MRLWIIFAKKSGQNYSNFSIPLCFRYLFWTIESEKLGPIKGSFCSLVSWFSYFGKINLSNAQFAYVVPPIIYLIVSRVDF